jgi:Matrixin
MKLSLALPLCLLSIGCSSAPPDKRIYTNVYTVDINLNVLDANDTVLNSLKAWENISGVKFNIAINDKVCDDSCFDEFTISMRSRSDFASIDPNDCGDDSCIALTSFSDTFSNVMIGDTVVAGVDNYTFPQTATHEIGHALGLIHTGPGTIMCVYQSCEPIDITCEDLNQYNKLRGYPLEGCL